MINPGRRLDMAEPLRVALVAGCLGRGGAEKQLTYMARALRDEGVQVRIFSLTKGEHYENVLRAAGIRVTWIGLLPPPPLRALILTAHLAGYRPHVIQSTHFFTNLYAQMAAPLVGAVQVGSSRNNIFHEVEANGRWGRRLLHGPKGLLVNSHTAAANAVSLGVPPNRIRVLPNAIDLEEFAAGQRTAGALPKRQGILVVAVSRLVRAKRVDRFVRALALARQHNDNLRGLIIGEGAERSALTALASSLGLQSEALEFAGARDDVPALLRAADMALHTSDHEGTPNSLLEAMAAGLPVITTPAGDAGELVQHDRTGFVVGFDDLGLMSRRLLELAGDEGLRRRLGEAGRRRVEQLHGYAGLGARLLAVYRDFALNQQPNGRNTEVLRQLFPGTPNGAPEHP